MALKVEGHHSEDFEVNRGVKQGDSISPTLFNIFINDLHSNFDGDDSNPSNLLYSKVGSLSFADDLLIISENKEGLQNSINNLGTYCEKWQLSLNVKKTKTMVIQNNSTISDSFIDFKGTMIQNVCEYKFLGCLLKSNGNLKHSLDDLAKKARKVLFSLREKSISMGNFPIKVFKNLFDKLITPILTYNSDISFMDYHLPFFRAKQRSVLTNKEVDHISFIDKTPFEKVHLNFCKSILGTRKSSSNIGVRSELGRYPIEHFIQSQSILYLARLHTEDLNPLLKESFELSKSLDSQGTYSWYTYVKDISSNYEIEDEITSCKTAKDVKHLKHALKDHIRENFKKIFQDKIDSYDENSKFLLYKKLNPTLEGEFYLSDSNFFIRNVFTKMRICDHNLEIERGRYYKIPRQDRLCKTCNVLEDEIHFIIKCKINEYIRESLFTAINKENVLFKVMSDEQKMVHLLNPTNHKHIRMFGFFLKQSLELRAEVS